MKKAQAGLPTEAFLSVPYHKESLYNPSILLAVAGVYDLVVIFPLLHGHLIKECKLLIYTYFTCKTPLVAAGEGNGRVFTIRLNHLHIHDYTGHSPEIPLAYVSKIIYESMLYSKHQILLWTCFLLVLLLHVLGKICRDYASLSQWLSHCLTCARAVSSSGVCSRVCFMDAGFGVHLLPLSW